MQGLLDILDLGVLLEEQELLDHQVYKEYLVMQQIQVQLDLQEVSAIQDNQVQPVQMVQLVILVQ
jgi:hypothetical protein